MPCVRFTRQGEAENELKSFRFFGLKCFQCADLCFELIDGHAGWVDADGFGSLHQNLFGGSPACFEVCDGSG